jgi:outer membrane biosynthesis protein TonB
MYLDLEDYRPDIPRVPSVISVREGVLLSLIAHAGFVAFLIFAPAEWFEASAERADPVQPADSVRYVQMLPLVDRSELARRLAEQSDIDRRSATQERPKPENAAPFSVGNTPEKTLGQPEERAAEAASPAPPSPAATEPPPLPDAALSVPTPAAPASGAPQTNLGRALRNLERYLQNESFDNPLGGATDQSADIQFDSKGVDFGPWLRRFVAQIKRNWFVPQVAELVRGRVVVQFTVLRNGAIVELRVSQPAAIDALTISAVNALKLSNPTAALPPEFPDERAPFIVTFHYNENIRDSR